MPRSRSSQPRPLIGGYAIGVVCGVLASLAARASMVAGAALGQHALRLLLAAGAVGLAMFGMVVLEAELHRLHHGSGCTAGRRQAAIAACPDQPALASQRLWEAADGLS